MTPTRGRSAIGKRCLGRAPYGHWKTTTFVCALRTTGLVAPLVLDGPINGPSFRAWVEQMLAPELRPGDIVVLDNLGSHKVTGIAEAVQAAGAQLRYLPPYSPDYNPIEQVFAKLKTLLRKAAKRTVDTLWATIGDLLDQFPRDECERYIRHAGYGQQSSYGGSPGSRGCRQLGRRIHDVEHQFSQAIPDNLHAKAKQNKGGKPQKDRCAGLADQM